MENIKMYDIEFWRQNCFFLTSEDLKSEFLNKTAF